MSAAAAFPLAPAGRPLSYWSRDPQKRGHLCGRGLTRLDKDIERQINKCLEDNEYPSVSKLVKYCECTDRAVYKSLKRLKAAGAIEGESRPGLPSVYRMPFEYRGKTATPERAFTGTPERAFRGSPPMDEGIPRVTEETTEKRIEAAARQPEVAAAKPSVEDERGRVVDMPDPETVQALIDWKVAPKKARELARMGTDRVARNIALMRRRNPTDFAAFLVSAIENDYAGRPAAAPEHERATILCPDCREPLSVRGSIGEYHYDCGPNGLK